MAVIFWLSSQSIVPHPGRKVGLSDDLVSYVAHASEFGLLAILVWRALRDRRHATPMPLAHPSSMISVLFSALYAASDEIHQLSIPGRTACVSDWLADVLGILTCVALLAWRTKHRVPK